MHWLVLNSNDAYDDDHLGFCLRNVSDAASTLSLSLDATLNNCAVAIALAVAGVDAVKKGGKWNGSVYWQTVTVCQLEIIGRPCKKSLWALAHCRKLLNSAVIFALLYRASGVCKTFTYLMNGLPITSNWQTLMVCQ